MVAGLQCIDPMRAAAAVLTGLFVLTPLPALAQGRFALPPARPTIPADTRISTGPVVAVAPVTVVDPNDDAIAAAQQASERLAEKLRPLEERLQNDQRLRRAGTLVGLGAIAIGTLRGTAPLTFAGTQAIRVGLRNQLTAIERRSGCVIEPSIGHRRISVTVSKAFR